MNDEARSEVVSDGAASCGGFGTPFQITGRSVEADDFCSVVQVDSFGIGGERQRCNLCAALPVGLAGLCVDRHHDDGLFVPAPVLADIALVADNGVDRGVLNEVGLFLINRQEERPVVVKNFLGRSGVFVGAKDLAGGGVDGG